jgi:hypothetical protein
MLIQLIENDVLPTLGININDYTVYGFLNQSYQSLRYKA